MKVFFPSQVVEYVDRRYPSADREAKGEDVGSFQIDSGQAPIIAQILAMLDGIPVHLVTLRGADLSAYGEALQAIRTATALWHSGILAHLLQKLPGGPNRNPVSTARKYLGEMPDHAADAAAPGLGFLCDEALEADLRADITAVESCLTGGQWKPATVVAGAVIEALLLDAVGKQVSAERDRAVKTVIAAGLPKGRLSQEVEMWNLQELTEVAAELKIIGASTTAQCRIARQFRNLVHPGKVVRLEFSCDRSTALSAVAAMSAVVRDRKKGRID